MYNKKNHKVISVNKQDAIQLKFLEVKVNGSFEDALRKFKSIFQKERVVGELKERSHYEKPSEKKRRKRREAQQRAVLLENRQRLIASGQWEKNQKRKESRKQKKIQEKISKQNVEEIEDDSTSW